MNGGATDDLCLGLNLPGASTLAASRAIDDIDFPSSASLLKQVRAAEECRASTAIESQVCAKKVAHSRTITLTVAALGLVGVVPVAPELRSRILPSALAAPYEVTSGTIIKTIHRKLP